MIESTGIQSWIHNNVCMYLPASPIPKLPITMRNAIIGVIAYTKPSKKVSMGRTTDMNIVCSVAHCVFRCWIAWLTISAEP